MKSSAYLGKFPIAYFHGRVLWRLADLRSTPHILASLAARETNIIQLYFKLNGSTHFAMLMQYIICLKFCTDLKLMISEATMHFLGL